MLRFRFAAATAIVLAAAPLLAETGLESDQQKFSYAVGLQIAQSLVRQGIEIDPDAFALALRDAAAGDPPRLSAEELNKVLESHEQKAATGLRETAKRNAEAGRTFLEKNGKRDEVKTLESGLQYWVVRAGDGPRPKLTDTVKVNYLGALIDGREFDSSERHGGPASLPLNGVIKGWQEAMLLMPVGSKWQIYVPSDLAYGARGAGGVIGPNETLIFDIELLGIE